MMAPADQFVLKKHKDIWDNSRILLENWENMEYNSRDKTRRIFPSMPSRFTNNNDYDFVGKHDRLNPEGECHEKENPRASWLFVVRVEPYLNFVESEF